MSYAVTWNEDPEPAYAGGLELADDSILLSGTAPEARESRRRLFYDELVGARVVRGQNGRPALVLECRNGPLIEIASVDGPGVLHELADRVHAACGKAAAPIGPAADAVPAPAGNTRHEMTEAATP